MSKKFFISHYSVVILILILFYCEKINALSISAYSISTQPFLPNNDGVVPCYLDLRTADLKVINNSMREQSNINIAEIKMQYQNFFKSISQSTICAFNAKELGIQKLPAIVFNQKYVVYGINDISQAKSVFLNYQENNE